MNERTIADAPRRIAALLAALGVLCASGCPSRSDASGESESGYPRTIATGLDSALAAEITLIRPIERIVPANASSLDYVFALGLADRVVAVPESTSQYANVEFDAADWEGRTFAQYLGESLLATRPDLVVIHEWQSLETTRLLEDVGIVVLTLPEPHDVNDVLSSIEALGRVLDREETSREVQAKLRSRIDALKTGRFDDVRVLSYTNLGTGAWTAGRGTSTDLVLALAGMKNAAAEHGIEGHENIDFELLLSLDPDVILVSASTNDSTSTSAKVLRDEEVLAGLSAVRGDRIVMLPSRLLSSNSHYVVDTAEQLVERVAELFDR